MIATGHAIRARIFVMQKKTATNTEDELLETAARWFARLRASDISPREKEEFAQWLAADNARQKAFSEISEVWEETGKLLAIPEPEKIAPKEISMPEKPSRTWKFPRMSLPVFLRWGTGAITAAVIILMVFFRAPLNEMWHQYKGEEISCITMNGEHRKINLSDGTIMEINADTCLTYDICATHRNIVLKKGEAFFKVAPNPKLPFQIHTTAGIITVLGTKFNVKTTDKKTAVDVEQGKVRVRTLPTPGSPHFSTAIVITKGQGVDYTSRGAMQRIRKANTESVNAWRDDKIYFNEDSLGDVAKIIHLQCNIKVFFPPIMQRAETFTGTFERNQPEEILNAIKIAFGLNLKIHKGYAQFTIP